MSRKKVRGFSTEALARLQRRQAAAKPAFAIKIAWPTAVIECLCGAGNMMVIVGDSAPVACPACGVKRWIQTDWTMHIGPALP